MAPSLKRDILLNKFMTDELPIAHIITNFKQVPKPKKIEEFQTVDGEVTTQASAEAQTF